MTLFLENSNLNPESIKSHTAILSQVLAGIPIATFMIDADHRIILWNRACEMLTRCPASEMIGSQRQWEAFYPAQRPVLADLVVDNVVNTQIGDFYGGKYQRSQTVPGAFEVEDFFPHFGEGGRWLHFTVSPIRNEQGEVVGAVELLQDVTERRHAEEQMRLFQRAVESTSTGVMISHALQDSHPIEYVNPAFESITGYSAAECLGQNGVNLLAKNADQAQLDIMEQAVQGQRHSALVIEGVRPDGSESWYHLSSTSVCHGGHEPSHFISIIQDITDQKRYEKELEKRANFDSLTGLANRNLLCDRMQQWIAHAHKHNETFAVVFMDLDHFKVVNDSLGHDSGDTLLREMAARLTQKLHPDETVARLGGDEFILLLHVDPEAIEHHLTQRLDALSATLRQEISIQNEPVHIGASIGVALFPRDGTTTDALMKAADLAMYRAKETGRNHCQFYAEELNERVVNRLQRENALHHAIERNEFRLHFQPQICAKTGNLIGVEALIRWQHPELGLLGPAHFIPLAEDNGLILPIGEWVIEEACRQYQVWQDAALPPFRVGINISARQFWKGNISTLIANALSKIDPNRLHLDVEVTESMLMQDPEGAITAMRRLQQLGIKIALDDFGTGYSSLNYLRRLPLDCLKIDQSFVHDVEHSRGAREIIHAIVGLARGLHLETIAEGVETQGQLEFIRDAGVDIIQGYYFSRPLSAEAFLTYMRDLQLTCPSQNLTRTEKK